MNSSGIKPWITAGRDPRTEALLQSPLQILCGLTYLLQTGHLLKTAHFPPSCSSCVSILCIFLTQRRCQSLASLCTTIPRNPGSRDQRYLPGGGEAFPKHRIAPSLAEPTAINSTEQHPQTQETHEKRAVTPKCSCQHSQ